MSNVFYPKVEKTTVITIPEVINQNALFHVVLPNLQRSVKALYVVCCSSIPKDIDVDIFECTEFEKYEATSNSANHDTFSLNYKYTYIRLPLETAEGTVINLVTHYSYDCKALKLTFISTEEDMFFPDEVISDSRDCYAVDYFGDDDYWKPQPRYRSIVSGHENCSWGECGGSCRVVSCGIQQGYEYACRQDILMLCTPIYNK